MTPISEQHQELLSAALDGQLSAAEQAQLDQQLEHDPSLAVEFAELRSMQALLQDLPPVRPPRSFTLDPALHAPKRSLWLSGWTRWVTVVGVFALMLTVGLQLTNQAEQSMTIAPKSQALSTESAAVQSQQNENENPVAPSMSTARSAAMPTPEMALLQQPTGGAADAMLGAYPPPALPYAAGSGPMSDTSDMARSISPEQATAMAGNSLNQPLIEPNGTSSPDTISLEPSVLKDQVLEQAAPAPAESESSLLLWFSIALVLGVGLAFAMGYWFKLHKQA